MKKLLTLAVAAASLTLSSAAWSYDADLAAKYQDLFAPVQGAKAGKMLHLMKPDALLQAAKKGDDFVTLDVRTAEEMSVLGMKLPNSLNIPASEVFMPQNLAKIPTDKKVVIVCKSGARAIAVGTALRNIGFNNVYMVKGGIDGISKSLNPGYAG